MHVYACMDVVYFANAFVMRVCMQVCCQRRSRTWLTCGNWTWRRIIFEVFVRHDNSISSIQFAFVFPALIRLCINRCLLPIVAYTGLIPDGVCSLYQLTHLILDSNQLYGEYPIAFAMQCFSMWLIGNSILWIVTDLGTITLVTQLHQLSLTLLWSHSRIGNLPMCIGDLPLLLVLHVHSNQLQGESANSENNISYAKIMFAYGENKLAVEENTLTSLYYTPISESGYIVETASNIYYWTVLLYTLLSGHLPSSIGKLKKLKEFKAYDNQFSGEWKLRASAPFYCIVWKDANILIFPNGCAVTMTATVTPAAAAAARWGRPHPYLSWGDAWSWSLWLV